MKMNNYLWNGKTSLIISQLQKCFAYLKKGLFPSVYQKYLELGRFQCVPPVYFYKHIGNHRGLKEGRYLQLDAQHISAFRLKTGILPLLFCRANARFLNLKKQIARLFYKRTSTKMSKSNFKLQAALASFLLHPTSMQQTTLTNHHNYIRLVPKLY